MAYDKDQHIAQLEEVNKALAEKLADINKRQMARNDKQALSWRNKYFYIKKKLDAIMHKENGEMKDED